MDTLIERYDNKPRQIKDRRSTWVTMGVIAVVLKTATSVEPEFVEQVYSTDLFSWIRMGFDWLRNTLGFPLVYVVIPFLLFKILGAFYQGLIKTKGCLGLFYNLGFSSIASVGWLYFWLTLLWGLNYNRVSLEDRLELSLPEINKEQLYQSMADRVPALETYRASIPLADTHVTKQDIPNDLEEILRTSVLQTMSELGYSIEGDVPVNYTPKGLLLRFSTAGMYFPYTGAANVDGGLHPLQLPFTLAHELAHGYGIGDEATCNFIAYLACRNNENPLIRYSGNLMYWRYVAGAYRRAEPQLYKEFRAQLPAQLVQDLDAVNDNNAKYPDIMPALRNLIYDTFLKTQGVEEGIVSYSKVVEWVSAYEDRERGVK